MLNADYIYNDFLPELNLVSPSENGVDKKLKTITFQVTDGCNLKCVYCYQGNKCNHIMDFETAKKTLDWIFDHMYDEDSYFYVGKTAGLNIEFIGGEPLMCMDLITQITDYAEQKFIEHPECEWIVNHCYSFSSNGTLYFDPKVQEYLKNHNNVTSMAITVDGCKELHDQCRLYHDGHGSYDDAIAAALHNLHFFGNNQTKITMSPQNVGYVYEGIKNMLELGFMFISINGCYEPGWTLENAKTLYEQMKLIADYVYANNLDKGIYIRLFNSTDFMGIDRMSNKNWCGCADGMYAVDYKGDLYPCIRFMESALGEEADPLIIGNIHNDFKRGEREEKNFAILNSVDVNVQTAEKDCRNCPIRSGCSWCTAFNYQHFGDVNHKTTYLCEMHKAMACGALYYYKLHHNKEDYDKIEITKEMALEIISEDEWNSLQWED